MNYEMGELSIEITHDCSLQCQFCSSNARCINNKSNNHDEQLPRTLSLQTIKNLLVEGRQCGAQDFSLSGGEPFVHPNLWEIMDYAQSLGYRLLLYTSGSMLNNDKEIIPITDEAIKKLLSYKNLVIIYDTQGCDEKKVDDLMGVKGSFENIIVSIKKCVVAKINIESHFVPLRPNIKYVFETLDFLEDLGVKKTSFLRWVGQGRSAVEPSRWELTKKEFWDFQWSLLRIKHDYNGKNNNKKLGIRIGHPLQWGFLLDPKEPIIRCRGGHSSPLIMPDEDGNSLVSMCPGWKDLKEYIGGVVGKDGSLSEIWNNSETYKIFRHFIHGKGYKDIKGKCKDCIWLSQCRGGCYCQRLLHNVPSDIPLEDSLKIGADPMCPMFD